jgi:diguanylate cyclase (GGDEF)-like protein/PAS domain S-box-containing protein
MTDTQKPAQATLSRFFPEDQRAYQALNQSQFIPFFQPLVTLRTGQLSGFEVLARWEHPTEGLIPPNCFIEMAERDGWIGALAEQIFEKAFAAASAIPNHLTLAINISPLQLRDLELPKRIDRLAMNAGFRLSRLIVEVTESALVDNLQSAAEIATELKAMGCRLAIDDFGTGYSSLLHLQSLPFDELKVDRSFVTSMTEKRDSRKIVAAVVGLGQSLGMITVAEGIETQEQAEMMLWLGCELGQGYFYGRPMPAEELTATISSHREPISIDTRSAWRRISASNQDVSPIQRLAQLQAVYDGAPVGLAFVDHNLRYLNLNQKLAEMNGVPVEGHLGNRMGEVVPELFSHVEPYLKRALNGEPVLDVEAKIPSTGETRLVSYQPAFDEAGEVIGVAVATVDITERKRTEEALKASEAHYREMVELNPQVLWIMDPQGRNLDMTPRWDKTTGMMIARSVDQQWLKNVHSEDLRPTVKAIAVSRRTESPIDVRYRVSDSKGNWIWKRARGAPRFDGSGKIVCWYGSVQDSEDPRKLLQKTAREVHKATNAATTISVKSLSSKSNSSEQRHQALLDLEILDTPPEAEFDDLVALASEICSTPISLVSLVDFERQWFKASIGLAASETPISASFCAYAIEKHGLFLIEDATKDERFKQNPLVLGDPKIRFYAGMPLYAGEGVAVGTLCVIDTVPRSLSPSQAKSLTILSHQVQARMELRSEKRKLLRVIAEKQQLAIQLEQSNKTLQEANSALERLATTDSLTGLQNRRAFENRMASDFSHALRKQRPLSILVLDIDNFKLRNDQCGHAAGDEALRHVGEVLQKVIRAGDIAARTGGEEFAILLPETTAEQACLVAERIQELLGWGDAGLPRLTASVGIAGLETTTTDWKTLIAHADSAMYEAKQTGKNRFVTYKAQHVGRGLHLHSTNP